MWVLIVTKVNNSFKSLARGSRSETLGPRIWILGTRIFSRRELPIKYFLIWYPINLRYLDKAPRKALLFCGIMSSPNFLYQYFLISLLVFQVLEVAYSDRDAA